MEEVNQTRKQNHVHGFQFWPCHVQLSFDSITLHDRERAKTGLKHVTHRQSKVKIPTFPNYPAELYGWAFALRSR